jgi:hypothetical protein
MKRFTGTVAGVTYTDPAAWEKAARDMGYRRTRGRTGDWRVGMAMRVQLNDGTAPEGQVWAEGPTKGRVWVALDSGVYVLVSTKTGEVCDEHGAGIGRVAA